jgi:hypothetical protein
VRASLDGAGTDEERAAEFAASVAVDVRSALSGDVVAHYLHGGGIRDSWDGLARYWRRQGVGKA